jgi:phosphatidylserine decarboxylase
MAWQGALVGFGLSMMVILLFAVKWRLPLRTVFLAGGGIAGATAIVFLWVSSAPVVRAGTPQLVVLQAIMTLVVAMGFMMLCFYSDPDRVPPEMKGVVLSAADGEVLYVRSIEGGCAPLVTKNGRDYCLNELTGTVVGGSAAYVIGIEMNFLDVHVNRCPISGEVKLLKHIGGNFISLRRDEAPFVNERLTTVIGNESLTIAIVQIGSRLVRRVESFLSVGEQVELGQRLGIIKLGSLVAVVVPQRGDVKIEVKPGDHVRAGTSVLARCEERRDVQG